MALEGDSNGGGDRSSRLVDDGIENGMDTTLRPFGLDSLAVKKNDAEVCIEGGRTPFCPFRRARSLLSRSISLPQVH